MIRQVRRTRDRGFDRVDGTAVDEHGRAIDVAALFEVLRDSRRASDGDGGLDGSEASTMASRSMM
jgi:hypothetical protein